MGRVLTVGFGLLLLTALLGVTAMWFAPRFSGRASSSPQGAATSAPQSAVSLQPLTEDEGTAPADPEVEVAAVPNDPISIEGDCTRAEVAGFLLNTGPRLERLFAGMEAFNRSGAEDFSKLDVAMLRDSRDALVAMSLPPCLHGARDEEVALANDIIKVMEPLSVSSEPSLDQSLTALAGMIGTVPIHVARIKDAHRRLEERFDLPPSVSGVAPYPAPGYP